MRTCEDLLQGFIADKILERNLLALADPQKGNKFRSFLLTVLDNYLRDKRRTTVQCGSLAKGEGPIDPHGQPEDGYHRAWAVEVLGTALERMQRHCETSGRRRIWEVFERRIVAPLLEQAEPPAYDEMVREIGIRSRAEAYNALITAKRMFARILRGVVGEYAPDEEVESEIGELKRILARGA